MNRNPLPFEHMLATMEDFDMLSHTILKGHLLIEEMLGTLIASRLKAPELLDEARLSFHQKLTLSQALSDESHSDPLVWKIARTVNSLRNEIAHNLLGTRSDRTQERIEQLYRLVAKDLEQVGISLDEAISKEPDRSVAIVKTSANVVCAYLRGSTLSAMDRQAYRDAVFSFTTTGKLDAELRNRLREAESRFKIYFPERSDTNFG